MNKTFIPPEWLDLGPVNQIPLRGARSLPVWGGEEIAVFRTGEDRVYALVQGRIALEAPTMENDLPKRLERAYFGHESHALDATA